jgi:hypothetical protein
VTDTRYLVHGVFWDDPPAGPAGPGAAGGFAQPGQAGVPAIRLQDPDGGITGLPLDAGTRLGFRLAAGGKHCLGHHKVHGPADRDHVLCPARALAVKGSQCERCVAVDDSRLIHDFHRGGYVPPGLRDYLMQPHWLYIATFANGASKVGTAANLRKWKRLAEQGAVVARYVAEAADGRVVRILEDLVTRDAGIPQQIRSAAKASALACPSPAAELDARNSRLAADVRTLLSGAGGGGFSVVDELWRRPPLSHAVCAPAARHAYPTELSTGSHGFRIDSLSGSAALARLDGADLEFVVNLAQLKARIIELGDHGTGVPAVQESLF